MTSPMNRKILIPSILALAVVLGSMTAAVYSRMDGSASTQGESFSEPVYGAEPPSQEQTAALADGYVTEEEIVAALNRAGDCLEAGGLQAVRPGHPQLEANLVLMRFTPERVDPAVGDETMRRCSERHSAYVSSRYQVQLEREGRAAPRPE
jgi:hypothetical protein